MQAVLPQGQGRQKSAGNPATKPGQTPTGIIPASPGYSPALGGKLKNLS